MFGIIKIPDLTFMHFVFQLVWKNTRTPLHLSLALCLDRNTDFSVNRRSFQRGVVATSWLAAETSDLPYVL